MRVGSQRIAAFLAMFAVLLGVAAAIVLVIRHRSEATQIRASFERYQEARSRIDVDSLVALTGPATQDWMGVVLRTARLGGREVVLSRTPLQAATVLEFRHLYSAQQLDAMSVADALRGYIGRWERDAATYELMDVRTKGGVASARLWLNDNSDT